MVFVVDALDFQGNLLHLIEASVVHAFLEGVFPDEFFDVQAGFLQVDFEEVDLFPEVEDGVLVDLAFDPGCVGVYLCSFSARSLSW